MTPSRECFTVTIIDNNFINVIEHSKFQTVSNLSTCITAWLGPTKKNHCLAWSGEEKGEKKRLSMWPPIDVFPSSKFFIFNFKIINCI